MTSMAWSRPVCSARGHPCEARPLPESVWSRSNPSSHHLKSMAVGFEYAQTRGHGQAVPWTTLGCIFTGLSNAS